MKELAKEIVTREPADAKGLVKHCVYVHVTEDSGSIFYVGRSARSKRSGKFDRAYSYKNRSNFWKSIVAKHGFRVSIVATFETKIEADNEEKRLISLYGKRENGGVLCNLADGGQGNSGAVRTEEWRKKVSDANRGRTISEEHRNKIRLARTGSKLSDEHKKKIALAAKKLVNFRLNEPEVMAAAQAARKLVKSRPRTAEHQSKINAKNKGSKRTLESRLRMSIAAKNRCRK